MTVPALCVADLHQLDADSEPRVLDLRLGERAQLSRARDIRRIIEKNFDELRRYGEVRTKCARASGNDIKEYWLNEAQAIILMMKIKTPVAADVRQEIVQIFMAWRHGRLAPTSAAPITLAAIGDVVDQKLSPIRKELDDQKGMIIDISKRFRGHRAEITDTTKDDLLQIVWFVYGGFDPSGSGKLIMESGQKLPNCEFDHFFDNSARGPEECWPIDAEIHDLVTRKKVPRHKYIEPFSDFQKARARWRVLNIKQLKLI